MKIGSLRIIGHKILGSIKMNLIDGGGNPIDTIILAGENGSGKSTLLDVIFTCTTLQGNARPELGRLIYDIVLNDAELRSLQENQSTRKKVEYGILNQTIRIEKDFNLNGWEQTKCSFEDHHKQRIQLQPHELNNAIGKVMKALFSSVEVNFNPQQIATVTTKDIDVHIAANRKSSESLASEIVQLFVDISSADANDLQTWFLRNKKLPSDALVQRRMRRFTYAFAQIFPSKHFQGIGSGPNGKTVEFIENGKVISLNDFSSGEKQIVFRGAFLIESSGISEGALVYIDEPEISLHPRWQIKILDYYKSLFTNTYGIQTSQIFIATHSPFIIHNKHRLNDKVFVMQKDDEGVCSIRDSDVEFFGWSCEKIVREAFQVGAIEPVTKSTVFVEGELDERYLRRTVELFGLKLEFEIKQIGKIRKNLSGEFGGETALNKMEAVFFYHPELLKEKIILFYDNDTKKSNQDFDRLLIRCAPKSPNNSHFKKGSESLLFLSTDFTVESFRIEKSLGEGKIMLEPDKTKICDWVLEHPKAKEILKGFEAILIDLGKDLATPPPVTKE